MIQSPDRELTYAALPRSQSWNYRHLGERQIEIYQCDANPLRPFRPTLPGEE